MNPVLLLVQFTVLLWPPSCRALPILQIQPLQIELFLAPEHPPYLPFLLNQALLRRHTSFPPPLKQECEEASYKRSVILLSAFERQVPDSHEVLETLRLVPPPLDLDDITGRHLFVRITMSARLRGFIVNRGLPRRRSAADHLWIAPNGISISRLPCPEIKPSSFSPIVETTCPSTPESESHPPLDHLSYLLFAACTPLSIASLTAILPTMSSILSTIGFRRCGFPAPSLIYSL